MSRFGESPVPLSYHRSPSTIEISASEAGSNDDSRSASISTRKKGASTNFFSAVSCLSVREAAGASAAVSAAGGGGHEGELNLFEYFLVWLYRFCVVMID